MCAQKLACVQASITNTWALKVVTRGDSYDLVVKD